MVREGVDLVRQVGEADLCRALNSRNVGFGMENTFSRMSTIKAKTDINVKNAEACCNLYRTWA